MKMKSILPALVLLVCLLPLGCTSNIKHISEIHVPEGSTETTDKPIEVRKEISADFPMLGVRIDNRFHGGAFTSVKNTEENTFEILIRPENAPINDSAWFAFRVTRINGAGDRKLRVKLVYAGGTHRYHPKISHNGKDWVTLAADRYQVAADKSYAILTLEPGTSPLWVAAQELIDSAEIGHWVSKIARLPFAKAKVIGKSVMGKDIPMLTITESKSEQRKYLIVLGRQHPPEATGTMALMSFIETISGNSELAKAFRQQYETVVIPLINPDGVDDGHWRHNHHGIDLNRDWQFFRQSETLVVSRELQKLKGKPVVFGIDFHSTLKDIFYVLQDSVPVSSPGMAEGWIKDIAAGVPGYSYRVQAVALNVPAASIWLNKEFGIPTVTYEVGDETERPIMRQIAHVAAEALMKRLLH